MAKYNTEYIKQIRPLSGELERYGIEVNQKGFANCPFHNEKTASFRVYDDGTFHCFGCGVHGDVINFTMLINNVAFADACKILDGEIVYSQMRKADQIRRKKNTEKELLHKAKIKFWDAFDDWWLNELIFSSLKPKSPFTKPTETWLKSLSRRSYLLYRLENAESILLALTKKEVII